MPLFFVNRFWQRTPVFAHMSVHSFSLLHFYVFDDGFKKISKGVLLLDVLAFFLTWGSLFRLDALPHLLVLSPHYFIGEHLVCLVDNLELVLELWIHVWMILLGFVPEGLLYLVRIGVSPNSQDLIVILGGIKRRGETMLQSQPNSRIAPPKFWRCYHALIGIIKTGMSLLSRENNNLSMQKKLFFNEEKE